MKAVFRRVFPSLGSELLRPKILESYCQYDLLQCNVASKVSSVSPPSFTLLSALIHTASLVLTINISNFIQFLVYRIPWKFCGKLYTQTFAKKHSQNPSYFLLNPYLNSAILKPHIKKFRGHAKGMKTAKHFCLKTFMAYSNAIRSLEYKNISIIPRVILT